jgi:type IV secretory pathway TrbD component
MNLLYLYPFGFLCLILVTSLVHKRLYDDNYKIPLDFHAAWASLYILPMIVIFVIYWLMDRFMTGLWVVGLVALERFSLYNPILNLMRHKSFFYLSVQSKTDPSFWDGLELKYKKYYPYVWLLSTAGFIYLLIRTP